jgi:hypothetical protein
VRINRKNQILRKRISRIANHGENSVSIELLIKLIVVLEGNPAIKFAA